MLDTTDRLIEGMKVVMLTETSILILLHAPCYGDNNGYEAR